MNELIKPGQRAMGIDDDGIRGPITDRELGKAFDEGRVTIIPRVPAPVTTPDDPPWVTAMKVAFGWHEVRDKTKLQAWLFRSTPP